ncbi:MAG: hypothetical protein C5B47_05590 [Verrucomicrobia bacterium]|nr:MAG: hypothetical protein C5B47_05590 [Verrucomicrobiota bacterium]
MGEQATPLERTLVWASDAASMVEVEAFCASLEAQPPDTPVSCSLSIKGSVPPKFSELKRLLSLLKPLAERQADFYIYCEHAATQKLLEFCGFPFIAQFVSKEPTESGSIGIKENT